MLPILTRLTGDDARWVDDLFAAVDAKDTERFLSFLTADAQFRFGSDPPVIGTAAIRGAIDAVLTSVAGLSHELEQVWAQGSNVICKGTITYTRHDGRRVSIPFCNVLGMSDGRIRDYVVYTDPKPLLAE